MLTRYSTRAPLGAVAILLSAACSEDDLTAPNGPVPATVAMVELEGTRPALYIQNAEGTQRTRIHFTGAIDEVPGNSPLVPPLTDENILALRSVKWSPDGSRVAFVATTAHDQAEVVVMKADGSDARIVSPNYAYVLGDVDWSPDGTRVAYIMATQPSVRGLDLFVSDVVGVPRVTRITTSSGYRGLGGTIRFAANGSSVWISQVTGEGGAPLFESVGAIRRVDLASGAISSVLENITGEVQAVSHSGAYAIVMRHKSLTNGVYDNQLVRLPIVGTGPEQLLVDGGRLDWAHLTTDDSRVLLLRAGKTVSTLTPSGGPEATLRGSGAAPLSADAKD